MPIDTRDPVREGPRSLVAPLPLILLLAGCAQAQSPPSGEKDQPSEQPEKQAAEKKPEPAAGGLEHPALGEKDAPVVMVEYSDYQ